VARRRPHREGSFRDVSRHDGAGGDERSPPDCHPWEDRRVRADRDVILEDRPLEFDVSAERIRIVRQDGLRSEKDVIADRTLRGNVRARLETRVRADGRGPVNSHVRSDDDVITDFGSLAYEPEVTGRKSVTDDHVVVNNRPRSNRRILPDNGVSTLLVVFVSDGFRPCYSHI